ncbi:MAG: hypothetical protein ACLRNQ_25610 [Flavonifractor plautii]
MSDTELQFRTSTFGGFQKQDVLNYIETSNQEHREKLEAVRRELAETEAAKAAQAEEIAAAQAQTEAKEGAPGPAGSWPPPTREAEERKLEISLLEEELEKAKQLVGRYRGPAEGERGKAGQGWQAGGGL